MRSAPSSYMREEEITSDHFALSPVTEDDRLEPDWEKWGAMVPGKERSAWMHGEITRINATHYRMWRVTGSAAFPNSPPMRLTRDAAKQLISLLESAHLMGALGAKSELRTWLNG